MNSNDAKRRKRILIIEDDPEIASLIGLHLKDHDFSSAHCDNGREGLDLARAEKFDLIILDLMLPELDGFEICKRLREDKIIAPILMLTSRADELDRVLGLELGADDYMTKPFSVRELMARVKAIFRRIETASTAAQQSEHKKSLTFGDLVIDFYRRKITVAGKPVELTVKEFDLLEQFASHPGRAYSRSDLLSSVWGYQFDGYDHTVNSHINRLRSKIEKDPSNPRYIKTVWGHGYRFSEIEELEQ